MNHYEFDSVSNSNEEKALSRKEKKFKEDEKFDISVKLNTILKYRGGTSIRMNANSQDKKEK